MKSSVERDIPSAGEESPETIKEIFWQHWQEHDTDSCWQSAPRDAS
ncbi:hypothetical protein [Phormidium sp. CCY1219]|nr:hypothetical protein [Phormidium sp. CCY1219]MEB3827295.1 hypothetical protein [Phormidium sp. CCY1219]